MRFLLLICLTFICLAEVPCPAQESVPTPALTIHQLANIPVIGSIGQPLGKVVEIEVTIIDGDELRSKEYQGRYLLRVDRVTGKKLANPPIMKFHEEFLSKVKLPSDSFELYEQRTGRKAESLSGEETRELQKGFINSTRKFLAYESGGFRGIPANLPNDYPIWADVRFSFYTYLVLVQDITFRK